MAATRLQELRLALMMMTRLPVGRLADPAPTLDQASWAFPLAGLPVAVIGWAGFAGAGALGLSPVLAALVALAAMAWVTGALHHDGLADFADGIGGGRDKDHCLEIMRDSRIGSYGVVVLIFAVGMQASALSAAGAIPLATFVFIALASRLMMLAQLVLLPPAREDGLGSAATSRSPKALLAGALALFTIAPFVGPETMVLMGAMCLPLAAIAWLAMRRIGGQTGDTLGATQLAAETFGWIAWSALAS